MPNTYLNLNQIKNTLEIRSNYLVNLLELYVVETFSSVSVGNFDIDNILKNQSEFSK